MTESVFRRIRDDHIQATLQLRCRPTERSGIQRMLRDGVIERNGPSEGIAPRQMSLALGQLPVNLSSRRRVCGDLGAALDLDHPAIRPTRSPDHLGDKTMPEVGQTRPAPTLEGYEAPSQESNRDRLMAQMRKLPKIDQNGRTIKGPDPTVTEMVTPSAPVPTMASALARAAELEGADLPQLLDSQAFCLEIAGISPGDSLGLQQVIRDHRPAPPTPGMASNPSQGHVAGPARAPSSGSLLERLQQEASKSLGQPEPPGSTFR